jgi:hypothetical protein
MKTSAIKLVIVALAMVLLVGCSQSQILASLEASVAATEALVATLQAVGKISPTIADEIENAIAGLPAAYRETAAELSSSDSAATMAAKVTEYYSSTLAALQALPPDAQFYASAISASIEAFLAGLPPAQATRSLARGEVSEKFDARRLNAIGRRSDVLAVQLTKLKSIAPAGGTGGAR